MKRIPRIIATISGLVILHSSAAFAGVGDTTCGYQYRYDQSHLMFNCCTETVNKWTPRCFDVLVDNPDGQMPQDAWRVHYNASRNAFEVVQDGSVISTIAGELPAPYGTSIADLTSLAISISEGATDASGGAIGDGSGGGGGAEDGNGGGIGDTSLP